MTPVVGHPDGQGAVITAVLPEGLPERGVPEGSGKPPALGPKALESIEPESIVAALVADGVRVRGFTVERGSLEDRFVALTGEGFDVAQ
jgi:ABC-2 type transport system ATP-binding protein